MLVLVLVEADCGPQGSRMTDLTAGKAKCLLPVGGVPLLWSASYTCSSHPRRQHFLVLHCLHLTWAQVPPASAPD